MIRYKKPKYNNKKTVVDGITFDSYKESCRYKELKALEQQGLISELELQKKYVLIPAQYETINGKRKCVECQISYYADFVYTDAQGETVVEDVKGKKTKEYIIKRKLMLFVFGTKIKEV